MSKGKLEYLDGIRGLMAVNVIIYHFIAVYYPQMYYQNYSESIGGPLSLFASTPLSVFVNGSIAVQYFFALTGFLVGKSVLGNAEMGRHTIVVRSVNRYIRLFPILCAATLFTYFTMVLGLQKHLEIAKLVTNTDFLPQFCNFKPTVGNLLASVFILPYLRNSAYVGLFGPSGTSFSVILSR